MFILKRFKKQRKCENCLPERKMTANFFYWKVRLLEPKNSKEEVWENWDYLKIRFLRKCLQNGIRSNG